MKNTVAFFSSISILLLLSTGLYSEGSRETENVDGKGILVYLEGDVSINNNPAEIGDVVESSDTVKTGENSYCEVVFGQYNVFKLDEKTITQINWKNSDIKVLSGGLSSVFTKLEKFLKDEKDFTISTPTIVAGVRGTAFYLKVEDADNTYLCICNGKLNIDNRSERMDIAAGHHLAYRFSIIANEVTAAPAGMLYHNDETMEKVAEIIDYSIPWNNNAYSGINNYQ